MITIKMPNPDKLFDGLDAKSLKQVKARAQNALLAKAKTLANKTVREEFYLKAEVVGKAMRVEKATTSNPEAVLVVSGPRLAKSRFRISPAKMNPRQQRRLIGTRVTKSRTSGAEVFAGAFTAVVGQGHIGVFRRYKTKTMEGKPKRLAIYELFDVSVAGLVIDPKVFEKVQRMTRDESPVIYNRELAYALSTASATVTL